MQLLKSLLLQKKPGADALATADPYYNTAWHIKNTGQCIVNGTEIGNPIPGPLTGFPDSDINAEAVWNLGYTGDGIVVAVLDQSLYGNNHPDISSKYIHGRDLFDDDPMNDLSVSPNTQRGHGQNCAGVIAAIDNNDEGSVGVAYDAQIIPVSAGFDQMASAIEHAIDFDADIINCSWGWPGEPDETIEIAIARCRNEGRGGKGIVVVCAAKNENAETDIFPGSLEDVIGVIASSRHDHRWQVTN